MWETESIPSSREDFTEESVRIIFNVSDDDSGKEEIKEIHYIHMEENRLEKNGMAF